MKKVFVDIYLAFNLGDDLFLHILSQKFPEHEFTVNYIGKNYDEFLSHYENVKRRKYTLINKVEQRLKLKDTISNYDQIAEQHDALLFLGGSIFREEDYHSSLYNERLKMVRAFKNRNKSIFILGANFGPFDSTQFMLDYKEMFKHCDDVCFRDTYSYELFKDLQQVRYAPDIVFQMEANQYKSRGKNTNTVGFSIIDVRHKKGLGQYHDDYINSTLKAIKLLVFQGYKCCLMSFCEREGDLGVIKILLSGLSLEEKKLVTVYEYKGDLKEAIRLIASFKFFIAARFHANIIALLLDVGITPVIYSSKTSNMLNDIGLSEIKINMSELHLQYNKGLLMRSIDNKKNLTSISKAAQDQFLKLNELLLNDYDRGVI